MLPQNGAVSMLPRNGAMLQSCELVGQNDVDIHESVIHRDDIDVASVLETLILDVTRNVSGRASRRKGSRNANDETFWFAGKLFGEVDFVAWRRFHQFDICQSSAIVILKGFIGAGALVAKIPGMASSTFTKAREVAENCLVALTTRGALKKALRVANIVYVMNCDGESVMKRGQQSTCSLAIGIPHVLAKLYFIHVAAVHVVTARSLELSSSVTRMKTRV